MKIYFFGPLSINGDLLHHEVLLFFEITHITLCDGDVKFCCLSFVLSVYMSFPFCLCACLLVDCLFHCLSARLFIVLHVSLCFLIFYLSSQWVNG